MQSDTRECASVYNYGKKNSEPKARVSDEREYESESSRTRMDRLSTSEANAEG
jgi:hypothetical protein